MSLALNGTEPTYEEEVKRKKHRISNPICRSAGSFFAGNIDVPDSGNRFCKAVMAENREAFDLDSYRKEWQKPLYFVYGQDDGKEQVLDEKWITGFAEGDLRENGNIISAGIILWKKEEQDYLVYITGEEGRKMKIPLTIRISPLVYDAAKPEKQGAAVCIFEKKCARINIFRLKHIWQNNFFNPQISRN